MPRTTYYPEPRLSKFLFASKFMAPIWAIVRIYLGWMWLTAGWGKVFADGGFNTRWVGFGADGVSGFLNGALAKTEGAHPSVTLWYAWLIENVFLPNATLFTNAVTINTATKTRRSEQVVGIGYDSDIDTASSLIKEAVAQVDGVLAEPAPDVLVDDLAPSSVNLRVRWWTDARRNSVIATKSAVVRRIKYLLNEHGIEIPFPVRTLYINDNVRVKLPGEAES